MSTHLVLNQSGQGEVVEEVGEVSPDVRVAIFPQALVIEAVHLCDLSRFVISAEDSDTVAVTKLEGNEESHGLYRVVTSVDVITHEQIVGVG